MTREAEDKMSAALADFLAKECSQIAHDMAHHVGDQIFEVMKRNGMAQQSEAGATAMLVIASTMLLEQAVDQCSRAAEEDCRKAVVTLFRSLLPSPSQEALDDLAIAPSDIPESTDLNGAVIGKYYTPATTEEVAP